ncbi:hypothetical protein [Niveispirillum lacus]|uniref:hypothetical protein n=1 Tax=Niveispirillum lacus TaxID=1981099 RepID=UPI001056AA5F|nr:hypothetical protein [Niveispirillum lacus]
MARLVLRGLNLSVSPVRWVRGHPPPRFHRDPTDHGSLVTIGEVAIGADPAKAWCCAADQPAWCRIFRLRNN